MDDASVRQRGVVVVLVLGLAQIMRRALLRDGGVEVDRVRGKLRVVRVEVPALLFASLLPRKVLWMHHLGERVPALAEGRLLLLPAELLLGVV